MDRQNTFRILGFPVSIRPGFVMFLLLVVLLYGGSLGLWIAGSLAVFTLVHELGHALCARAFGCTARISLDFLAGYASFIPPRPLRAIERSAIAMSGPAVQFAAGMLVLVAMGHSPFSRDSILASEAATAVWWAGVALALINLFPAVPLDGGIVLTGILEGLAGEKGYVLAVRLSLVFTVAAAVACAFIDGWSQFFPFLVLLVFLQIRQARSVEVAQPEVAVEKIKEFAKGASPTDVDFVSQVAIGFLTMNAASAAVEWASTNYASYPHPRYALFIAEGLAQTGNRPGAMQWIERAVTSCVDLREIKNSLTDLPMLSRMAGDGEIQELFRREMVRRRA